MLVLGATLAVLGVMVAIKRATLTADDLSNIVVYLGTLTLGLMAVLIVVRVYCGNIHPVEQFVGQGINDTQTDPMQTLWTGIAEAEEAVCKYITRADGFIQNDLGKPGHDNPSLVSAAQQKARDAAGGPLTDCTAAWPATLTDVSSYTLDQELSDADNRLTRLETTLQGFTGVVFQNTYNKTVKCPTEGFATSLTTLQQRLTAVQAVIKQQQSALLGPIDQKTEDIKKGHLSDCDKARAKSTAIPPAKGSTT
jgi:uncharacterized protein YukE